MSDDKKGSDLDIFEGLGKKSSGRTSAAPPPPPGSGAHVAAKPSNSDMKRTLMGIPGPAPAPQSGPQSSQSSASMKATQVSPSRPPPPPGRNALADLPDLNRPSQAPATKPSNPPSGQMRASQAPAAPSTRPTALASTASQPAQPLAQPRAKANGGQLDMDWEDDEGDTHIFDKEASQAGPAPVAPISEPTIEARPAPAPAPSAPVNGPESRRPEHANMDDIMSAPPRTSSMPAPPARVSAPPVSQPPPMPVASASQPPGNATLSGAFGALGQTNGQAGPTSASFRSGPPASQSMRSAPPPPPGSLRNPSTSTAPMPPPPPPGQTTTAPMHMPMPQPPSAPPPMAPMPSAPPPVSHHPQSHGMPAAAAMHSQAPMPHMPPPSRAPNAMEATAMVPRPQPSKAPLVVLMLLLVAALVGGVVFMMMPRSGTLIVNVADAKGGAVQKLEVTVDGKVVCSQAPCILKDVASGVHQVSVTATGYDTPAPRAVTIEGRKDATLDFSLSGGKGTGGGTGFKVAGNQPGVKVIVDGVEKGALPQEIRDLEPGSHTLRFVGSDRYAPLEKTINVAKDEVQDLSSIQLKVVKGKAMITLGTPGAKVYLVNGTNRKEVPQFPIAIDFDPNEKWQLEAKKDGFDDFSQPISFDDGQAEKQFNVTLNAKGAHPAPVAQPATQPVAQPATPATKPAGFLKPTQTEEPATKPEPTAKKEPAAAAGSGEAFLNINSLPASTVVLDGKPLGATPRLKVQVSPGSHTILFINSELSLKKSITVQVGAGETKAAFAKLRD